MLFQVFSGALHNDLVCPAGLSPGNLRLAYRARLLGTGTGPRGTGQESSRGRAGRQVTLLRVPLDVTGQRRLADELGVGERYEVVVTSRAENPLAP